MAYVNVPNDITKIKTKIAFNLTKRQLICFGIAAVIGIPAYFLTRLFIGNTGAMFLMIGIMLPCFLCAMYERDGLPFEVVLKTIVTATMLRPQVRVYKTENFYDYLNKKEVNALEQAIKKTSATSGKKR